MPIPVIDRSIGHIHACKLAEHGLIFKYGLKNALADLGLVRGIGCKKFLFGYHALYDGRYVMAVCSRPSEYMFKHHILFCDFLHLPDDFHFAKPLRKL